MVVAAVVVVAGRGTEDCPVTQQGQAASPLDQTSDPNPPPPIIGLWEELSGARQYQLQGRRGAAVAGRGGVGVGPLHQKGGQLPRSRGRSSCTRARSSGYRIVQRRAGFTRIPDPHLRAGRQMHDSQLDDSVVSCCAPQLPAPTHGVLQHAARTAPLPPGPAHALCRLSSSVSHAARSCSAAAADMSRGADTRLRRKASTAAPTLAALGLAVRASSQLS